MNRTAAGELFLKKNYFYFFFCVHYARPRPFTYNGTERAHTCTRVQRENLTILFPPEVIASETIEPYWLLTPPLLYS